MLDDAIHTAPRPPPTVGAEEPRAFSSQLTKLVRSLLRAATAAVAIAGAACGRIGFDDGGSLGPSLDLDFTSPAVSGVLCSRDSRATYVDATGLLRTAALDEPRFDHDPSTLEPRGLLVEERRTNLMLSSADLTSLSWFTNKNAVVSSSTIPSPGVGELSAEVIDQDTVADARRGQGVVIPDDGSPYVFSIYLHAGTRSRWSFSGELINGSVWIQSNMTFDLTDGMVTQVPPQSVAHGVERYQDGWFRVWIVLKNNSSGNTSAVLSVWGDRQNPTTTGSVFAWGAQVEQGIRPSSYIATGTSSATRAADDVTTSDISWLAADRGTLRVVAASEQEQLGVQPAICLVATATARLCLGRNGDDRTDELVIDATPSQTIVGGAWPTAGSHTAIAAWDSTGVVLADEAGALMDPSTAPDGIVRAAIGSDTVGYFNGHLRVLTYWPERLSSENLVLLASP